MEKIVEIKPLDNFSIWIKFEDNFTAEFNIKPFIRGGISNALLDKDFFKRVNINEFNGITWENGFDFCPNFVKEYLINSEKPKTNKNS